MLRRMTITLTIVALGVMPAIARGTEGPANKEFSATETMESATQKLKDTTKKAGQELSDSWITLKTKLALFAEEQVSSSGVHVSTRHGVIALRGKVGSEDARRTAEEVARRIDGVKRVDNHLVVVVTTAQKVVERQDDQIVNDVEGRIKQDSRLRKADIEVHAANGIVTLSGDAPSLEMSVRASEVASRVPGVRAVRNEVTVEKQGSAG